MGGRRAASSRPAALEIPLPGRAPRIVVLEDEEAVQKLVQSLLKVRGLDCEVAGTVAEARELVRARRPDLLIVDVNLPDGSGLSLLDEAAEYDPLAIVMTASADVQTAVQAIRRGAIDFITKPFAVGQFLQRMDTALEEWRSRESLLGYGRALETLVRLKEDELSRTTRQMDDVRDMTVSALGAALNLKDHETADHCVRVSGNCVTLGRALGLSEFELKNLKWGAYLHDVGKIGIPEQLLLKPGTLTSEERSIMERHPVMGYTMIRSIEFLQFATDVVLCHHENFDGSGYPRGLRGERIPLAARIFSPMDTMDAMTSDRPYRPALPLAAVREEVRSKSGTKYDPEVAEAFLALPQSTWLVQGGASQPHIVKERSRT